jgi:serine protease Do
MSRQRALPYLLGVSLGASLALVLLIFLLVRGADPLTWFSSRSHPSEEFPGQIGNEAGAARWGDVSALMDSISIGRNDAIVEATRLASPAVVSITVIYHEFVRVASNPMQSLLPDGRLGRGGVRRQPFEILGSGVIIDPRGYIVTNDHVLAQNNSDNIIFITLADGRQYEAEEVGRARSHDLALLRFTEEVPNMPIAYLGDSDLVEPGEWAIAIGAPYRELLDDPSLTVTVGVISALHRDLKQFSQGDRNYFGMLQTDAAIHQGNSGGALVNARGEVIGINAFIISGSDGGSFGASFAVPINRVRWVVNEILEFGGLRPRFHGFDGFILDKHWRLVLELDESVYGLYLTRIVPDSPALEAGLQAGDIIQAIGGQPLLRGRDFYRVMYESPLGSQLSLRVQRGDEVFDTELTLVEANAEGDGAEH